MRPRPCPPRPEERPIDRTALAANLAAELAALDGVEGVFLAGSLGAGTGDRWSDVDLVAVVAEGAGAVLEGWPAMLATQGEVVLHRPLWGRLAVAVYADWTRVDLYLTDAAAFLRRPAGSVRALHDPSALAGRLKPGPAAAPDPARAAHLIEEYLRVLGLMPVVMGRGELLTAVDGAHLMKAHLRDLMLEESPVADRGGALHLSKLLPPEDVAALAALPFPGPDRAALLASAQAHWAAFAPRARALADRLGLDWPDALERAARDVLARELGLTLAP
ncbi:MAG: nucleotidyltransferase domain-containing protein [Hasllibacter sp.]